MPSWYAIVSAALAVFLGAGAVRFAVHMLHRDPAPAGERVPTAPLQRLAIAALASGGAPALATVAVLLYAGVDGYDARPAVRLLVQLLALVTIIAGAAPVIIARRRAAAGALLLDERDTHILATATVTQSWLLLGALVTWTLALTEHYWPVGAVPLGAVAVMGWTLLMLWALALPLGIVVGYRTR